MKFDGAVESAEVVAYSYEVQDLKNVKRTNKTVYYPLFLNISGKKCIVAGGGQVALRKAKSLLDYGADIEIISSRVCAGLSLMAEKGQISIKRKNYQKGDIKDASIVVAATGNRTLNRDIAGEARQKKVPVNVVDDPANCDFIVPSIMRRGDINIAISTGGKSPALARKIRLRLEKELGDEYSLLAQLVCEVRTEMKKEGIRITPARWEEAIDLNALAGLLKKGRGEEAKKKLKQKLTGKKERI